MPFKRLFGVGALLFVAGPLQGAAVSGEVVLCVLAVGKFLYDLQRLQLAGDPDAGGCSTDSTGAPRPNRNRLPWRFLRATSWFANGHPSAALLDALGGSITYTLTSSLVLIYLIAAFFLASGATVIGLVFVDVLAVFDGFRSVSRYLRHEMIKDQGHDGTLVVYDRVLEDQKPDPNGLP